MRATRILFTILFIFTVMIANSSSLSGGKPDFAFPATVSKDADKDLQKAIDSHDAHAAINAMIRYYISQSLIDSDSIPSVISKTEQISNTFSNDTLHGLFVALLGQMYYNFYSGDEWKYDRRELPLSPLPDNITEWSGQQFKAKICGLALESISGENAKGLSKGDISAYSDIITFDTKTAAYYPTLLDFAYINANELVDECGNKADGELILTKALENSKKGSAPFIYWSAEKAAASTAASRSLVDLLKQMSDNEYAGYIFTKLRGSNYFNEYPVIEEDEDYSSANSSNEGIDKETLYKQDLYALATGYLNRFPKTYFRQNILDITAQLTLPSVNFTAPSICAPDAPFEIKITNENAGYLTLDVYKLKDSEVDNYVKTSTLKSTRKPVLTHTVKFNGTVPFKTDSTITLSISQPGYYKIIPRIPGKDNNGNVYNTLRCIPVYPVAVSNVSKPVVAVVDPVSGSPIQGVGVTLKSRGMPDVKAGTTDQNGLAKVNSKDKSLVLSYKGDSYDFSDVWVRGFDTHVDTAAIYHASVVTDRAIYHPGEKLQLLAVVSKSYNKLGKQAKHNICNNKRIKITLLDANYTEVSSTEGITDDYGRVKTDFDLPSDGLTGNFTIQVSLSDSLFSRLAQSVNKSRRQRVIGSQRVMVSDFKLPDFEVTDALATNDTPSKGDVNITAKATTYSGMPVANAKATIIISGKSRIWWRNNSSKIFSTEAMTGDDGKLSVVIPDSVFAANKDYSFFDAAIEVESATGTQSSALVVFSTGKKYMISVDCDDVIDGNLPFSPKVELHASDGSVVDLPLTWKLTDNSGKVIAQGDFTGKIDFKNIVPGKYDFIVTTADTTLADDVETSVTIYNVNSDIVPSKERIWVPSTYCVTNDGKADILYGIPSDDTWVYCTISDGIGTLSEITLTRQGKGYHHIPVTIPDGLERIYVNIFSVNNLKISSREIIVNHAKQDKTLKIVGETFRDKLIPGSEETWKIRITGADGKTAQSALMLDMYNKALESLSIHNPSIAAYGSPIFSPLRLDYQYCGNDRYSISAPFTLKARTFAVPQFYYYGKNVADISDMAVMGYGSMKKSEGRLRIRGVNATSAPVMYNAAYAMADDAEFEVTEEESMDAGAAEASAPDPSTDASQADTFDYRDDYVPLAVWAPMLTTDSKGNITYSFTVPNANTTWRLAALAWTKDFELGQLMRDFVAAKPLMVQPNLPRFLRNGDSAVIIAYVMNNSDETISAATVVELFNPVTGAILDKKEFSQDIAPGASATISSDIIANYNLDAIGYRIRTSNGDFSDGEQSVIRILSSEAALIETQPFYLNPGEKEFSAQLPKEKDARISLTFMENPSWTILTALPGLRTQIDDYANSAAAALYSAGIARGLIKDNPRLADALKKWSENPSDSTLVSMLEKNEDLKIALLNATPWVQSAQSDTERMASLALLLDNKQVDASISQALDILKNLQQSDGGWKWSKWCDESSVWVTSNVLSMMADLKTLGWLPADSGISSMINKALSFYDRKVKDTDLIYAIVRPQFNDTPISSNGKSVIARTIKEISTDWKQYNDVVYKAMAAEALYRNKEQILASELMRSISEFGVMTKDQGLKFPSVNALYNYAILLKAYALIKPGSKEVDGLRQQLVVRKQATDWGSAVVTTEVVQAILCSGSNWMVDAKGAEITVGSKKIEPVTPVEQLTGWLRADLSNYAGKKLTIETSGTGPAYGAVYAQFARNMADVKASSCDDLDIEKTIFVRRGTQWEEANTLQVGDRVKVQLTIHCMRNLQYVSIIDQRPACYEPVDQLPGWLWSEGVGFYRENRDSQTQLHVIYMRPGTYLLTYEMNVNNAGEFSSGVATIQSQYAPEISAHSSGRMVTVGSK